jgi:hypothetical protein
MGRISCPETSIINYESTTRNTPVGKDIIYLVIWEQHREQFITQSKKIIPYLITLKQHLPQNVTRYSSAVTEGTASNNYARLSYILLDKVLSFLCRSCTNWLNGLISYRICAFIFRNPPRPIAITFHALRQPKIFTYKNHDD